MAKALSWKRKTRRYLKDLDGSDEQRRIAKRNITAMGRTLDNQAAAIKNFKKYGWN